LDASTELAVARLISTETDEPSDKSPDLWIRSLDYSREWIRNDLKKCFDGEKLTTRSVERVRSVIFGTLKKLESREIVKNVDALKENLVVKPNPDNIGFLTCRIPVDVVVGLHGIHGTIDLIIS
jgi:phage tail sheath gpL-like